MNDAEVARLLGSIEAELKGIHKLLETATTRMNDHSLRIRALERSRAFFLGIFTLAQAAMAAAVTYFIRKYGG